MDPNRRQTVTEREQLEQAIAHMEAQRATLGDAVVDASIAALREKLATLEPEPVEQKRRQVTVLLADVAGSTAMADEMDAEDVTELMNALWERLDAAIVEHGGLVDKHMGDAVMALWGAEQAREDDPERAIRAALGMQAALATFRDKRDVPLAMRIGVNTGPVLLGEVGTTHEFTAMGDTVNVTSRLEHAAPVDGVLVSHDTYRHVRGVFDVQALESIQVRGKAEPIRVYVVERAKPRAFRVGTRGVQGVETRMIGRQAELEWLQDTFHVVADPVGGERQMVTIVGEAGIGKSRLLYEFGNWLDLLPETVTYFRGRATLEMRNHPYALIRDLFSFRFLIRDSDSATVVREKMEDGIGEALGQDEQSRMKAHFVGQLLGFDFGDSPHLQGALDDAQQIRDRALVYLSEFFRATTARYPTVVFLEDIHWADDSSLNLIDHLALRTSGHRLLIVCLARPTLFERRPQWGTGRDFHHRLELRPLAEQDGHRLVQEILQKVERVPEAMRELVVSRAEGNPFYVEELIKMLIEDQVIVRGEEQWHVESARLQQVRVPPTLTGVLQARLDSLPAEERTVLQQASVVGRIFWDDTVQHLNAGSERTAIAYAVQRPDIAQDLALLHERELIFPHADSAFAGVEEYIFKHAILRDVTYESVLRRVRRVYHVLVAEWMIEHGGERADEYVGLIADHLEAAGQAERAVTYLRRTGEQAMARYANVEAVRYLSRALELTPETDYAERYALLLAREKVYDLQGEREAQRQDLAHLEEIADVLDGESPSLGGRRRTEVALRKAHCVQATGDYPLAIAVAQKAICLAQADEDVRNEAAGHFEWGRVLWRQGEHEAAVDQLERARALAQTAGALRVEADSLRVLGLVSHLQGDYDKARSYGEWTLDICRQIGDRQGEALTLNNLGNVCADLGDYDEAETYYGRSLSASCEIGYSWGESLALSNLGTISSEQGEYVKARTYLQQALRSYRGIGDQEGVIHSLGNLGFLSICLGDYDRARDCCEQALRICREIGSRASESNVLTNLSLLSHHLGDDKTAHEQAQQALLIAQEIGIQPLQGTAWAYLGHALAGLGHMAEAARAYEQATNLRREIGQVALEMESLAGLARVSLDQGRPAQAQAQVEEILSHLETSSLDGADEPLWTYLTCYRVLDANEDPRSEQVLDAAYHLLSERALKIDDEELRRSLLTNVPYHREIVEEFRRIHDEDE
jgi:class 3 adenylate cyclase/tetratricopeptide (TPR) repeat protein